MYIVAWHSYDAFDETLKGAVVASYPSLVEAKERMLKDFKQHIANYLEEVEEDACEATEEINNLSAAYITDDGYFLTYYIEEIT